MKMPPLLLKLTFGNYWTLWLPLFLIGPVLLVALLAAFLIMLPFALLSFLFTWRTGWWYSAILSVPLFFNLVCHLSGCQINVEDERGGVNIEFV